MSSNRIKRRKIQSFVKYLDFLNETSSSESDPWVNTESNNDFIVIEQHECSSDVFHNNYLIQDNLSSTVGAAINNVSSQIKN